MDATGLCMLVDEEGRLNGQPLNYYATDRLYAGIIAGTAVVLGLTYPYGDLTDISEEHLAKLKEEFERDYPKEKQDGKTQ